MQLVFDIGGTSMRLTLATGTDLVDGIVTVPTPQDFPSAISTFVQQAQQLSKGEKIDKIAGGIAGPLDKSRETLVSAPNLPDWVGKPLRGELESAFGAPVILENDTALGGLGEAVWGT